MSINLFSSFLLPSKNIKKEKMENTLKFILLERCRIISLKGCLLYNHESCKIILLDGYRRRHRPT